MLIDSHCHLDYFNEDKLDSILDEIIEAKIGLIQTISTKISEFETKILPKTLLNNIIYCSIGTHPCHAHEENILDINYCLDLINKNKKIIGIGETGLDYYHSQDHKNIQKKQFERHIELSIKTQKPVIVHTRNADNDTIEILDYYKKINEFPILIHCFTGDKDFLFKLLDLNCTISYSGIVTFKNAKEIYDSMINTPLKNLMIETDAPFLAPVPKRGQENRPAFVKHTAEFISNERKIDYDYFIKIIYENFRSLFKI
jgi:TatD DNase family protein